MIEWMGGGLRCLQVGTLGLRQGFRSELQVMGKFYRCAWSAEMAKTAVQSVATPDAERGEPSGRMWGNDDHRFRFSCVQTGSRELHGGHGRYGTIEFSAPHLRNQDGGVRH